MVLLSGPSVEGVSKVKLKLLVSVVPGPVAVPWCSSTNMVNSGLSQIKLSWPLLHFWCQFEGEDTTRNQYNLLLLYSREI